MTIQREEPGIMVLYCDECGERVILDDTDIPDDWTAQETERVRFKSDYDTRGYTEEYNTHSCGDCA